MGEVSKNNVSLSGRIAFAIFTLLLTLIFFLNAYGGLASPSPTPMKTLDGIVALLEGIAALLFLCVAIANFIKKK